MANAASPQKPAQQPTPFPAMEEEVLDLWDKQQVFKKTLAQTQGGKPFVFFEGPPTANGKPGIHHVLARVYKDVIVRYQTMRGRFVERKAGWDTHGLPVELQVEKQLKISGKQQIENLVPGNRVASIEAFNNACKQSVMEYRNDFEVLTRRIGFWLDMANPYVTYDPAYIESVWSILKTVWDKQLMYKGHKVVPHCPRCETTLSSHEVAQGYKSVIDTSIFVKFKVQSSPNEEIQKQVDEKEDVFILSWTTTPWTLPGNVALAIGKAITYVLVKHEDVLFVVAKDRLAILGEDVKVQAEFSGESLVGTVYEPLFAGAVEKGSSTTAWTVLAADFVTTTDGTGVVHTAVMYGEDDYQLGKATGLPMQHTVDQSGKFLPTVAKWAGKFVKSKDVETGIIQDLQDRGLLFRTEPCTHDYPFCWRCDTPLLYYAKDSWFIKMSAVRDQLLKNNDDITWVPSHLKQGRFGEWLREVKDWAISRERYWGTPLPIWTCQQCKHQEMLGSYADLQAKASTWPYSTPERQIFVMRHGEAQGNLAGTVNTYIAKDANDLTDTGKAQVVATAEKLHGKVDLIVTSDFLRAKQTAALVKETLGGDVQVIEEPRLREIQVHEHEGKRWEEIFQLMGGNVARVDKRHGNAETLREVAVRVREAVDFYLNAFPNKSILFVSHGDPLLAFEWLLSGQGPEAIEHPMYLKTGAYREVTVHSIQLNPHRPYIDDVQLTCPKCQGTMVRVPEVIDVWFDAGSMPFAQWHYPFANQERVDQGTNFPAEYIAEGIDQTRGWFYTLLAISTLLEKGTPYRNVISLGHIMDAKGKKMSKSKGNVVVPADVINQYGADALRLYMFTMSQAGEPKNFDVQGVDEVVKKTLLIFWNVVTFATTYVPKELWGNTVAAPTNVLDQWVLARLGQVTATVTEKLEAFDPTTAGRALRDFITDLSTWYLRRSRDRLRPGESFSTEAGATLVSVIRTTAVLLAPFAPFIAEKVFQTLRQETNATSVHLAPWPAGQPYDEKVLTSMTQVQKIVELGHAIRKEQNLKIRQPLATLATSVQLVEVYHSILSSEMNVLQVTAGAAVPAAFAQKTAGDVTVGLDTQLTEELQHQGLVRELARHVNDLRKTAGFTVQDVVDVEWQTDDATLQHTFTEHAKELQELTRSNAIRSGAVVDVASKKEMLLGGARVTFGIRKP